MCCMFIGVNMLCDVVGVRVFFVGEVFDFGFVLLVVY